MVKNEEKVKYWLECAEYDFQSAKVMLEGKRYLYVGFMCHQTIEKSLKACCCAKNDNTPPYTHRLIKLGREAGVYDDLTEEFKNIIDVLEPLDIEARYPSHKEELLKSLSSEKCGEIIERTGELFQWITKRSYE
jgi:HEPN domain-containing protein